MEAKNFYQEIGLSVTSKKRIREYFKERKWKKAVFLIVAIPVTVFSALFLSQQFVAHRNGYFKPEYAQVALTENSDYETIFLQTGLGKDAVDKLLRKGDFQKILDMQTAFYRPPEITCTKLLGWFTMEDRLASPGPPLVDVQPGDVLLSFSTHTLGWRHGHAGLVIDENTVLECSTLGRKSGLLNIAHWTRYSNYVVLRLKGITPELQQKIVEYAMNNLNGVPYHLTSGFVGDKAPEPDEPQFGMQCSYLVWYAWNHFGYDLDSDGGRLVSSDDLLHSDYLEVVQIYGMDPRDFLP